MKDATHPDWSSPSPWRRPRSRGRLIRRLVLFAACVILADALIGDRGLLELLRSHRAHAELSADIERARQENLALREQARQLREDPRTLERLARQELGLIRPGEILFIVSEREE